MSRLSFTERMDEGKVLTQVARNKGRHTGKSAKGWTGIKRQPMSGLDMIEAYYNQFKTDIHYNAYLAVEYALFGHEWEGL